MKESLNFRSLFRTGFFKNQIRKMITPKFAFIFAGLASTVWFILRVIPKPQRAAYPCMRAAAPIMSSFIIWTLSVVGMGAFYKKAKTSYSKSKYVISGLFVIAFLASMAIFQGQNAQNIFAKPATPGVNAVIGTGKGIFPGRVAWTYSPDAAKWTGGGNFWSSGNNQSEYNAAFTAGIKSLSGGSDDATSWDLMFKWFNGTHGRTGTGYVAGDKIAIKINQNNSAYSGAGGGGMNANPYACVAIVASLVNANVPQADIWIGDPSRAVTDNIFNLIHTAYPDVNVVDYFGNNGRKTTGCTTGDYPQYGKMSTCFATARYLVSLPILKGHPGQNFSFGAKNWFGAGCISNNWANNPHPGNNDFEATYLTSPNIGGKVILWCMDASYPCSTLDATPSTNKGANFFMSLDGAAEESVSLDMWNMYYGKGLAGENYIDIAANGGAGAHEHWNNATDKKYTRNLNPTANGIELVYITKPWPNAGPSVSISAPASGTSFEKGDVILINGTATPEPGKTITSVEVKVGTTPLTVTGTTSWSCQYTTTTAGDLVISAITTSTSAKTGTANATVTVKEPVVAIDVPAKIEAENFTSMFGITVEATTDAGGGSNIGYTDIGDWLEYKINVPATGTYTVDFRVASAVTTGIIELRNAAGTKLTSLAVTTATGGWQNYVTSPGANSFTLNAGVQFIRIHYTGAGINLNWFEVKTSQTLTTITVTPATATIIAGQTQQFTAIGKDQFGVVMPFTPTWTATGGTISTSGLYTGGPTGTFTVKAASGTVSGSAQITVNPQVLTTITLTPATTTLSQGQAQLYTAVGKDQNGTVMTIPSPTWLATGGTITTSGLYTAGTTSGNFTVTLQSGTVSGNASVTIAPKVLTTITVTPATTTLTSGQTQQYTAVGKDQNGNVMAFTPTWSATGGDIDASGLYTAGNVNGNYTVTAKSGTVTGTAPITIGAIDMIIQAEDYSGMFGVQKETTADVGGGQNVGYIDTGDWMTYVINVPQTGTYSIDFRAAGWSATGRISLQDAANNQLTAAKAPNNGAGSYQVWNTVPGETNFQLNAGSQTIRIYAIGGSWNLNWFEIKSATPLELSTITLSPASATMNVGGTQQFTAVGKDQNGNTITIPSPVWSATGGTVSTSGLFTAGTTTGNYTVTLQSGTVSGTAQVAITQQVLTSITVTPTAATLNVNQTQQYAAVGKDQNGIVMSNISFTWTATGGTISTSGLYTAGATAGNFTVTAQSGSITGNTTVTLVSGLVIPGKIQAEAYAAMFGIQTETTTDVGGGQNIGYVDAGDWLDYNVNVSAAGRYDVSFRVASQVATGAFQLKVGANVLAIVAVPNTGGWQIWQTVTVPVTLSQGAQTMRILATGVGLNLNWMDFVDATNSTVTLNPTADAYVRGGTYAATNYGTTVDLLVKSAPETDGLYTRKAYMQFNVAGITGVQNAVVRLYAGTVAAFSVKVNETTDAWTETAINWNNAPVAGNLIATTAITTAGVYYEWNVTSYVQSQAAGDGIVSLVFSDAATTNAQITFNSKEATANKPQLVVTSGTKSAFVNSDKQEVTNKELTIYPNPVSDEIHIQNADLNSTIEVYNLSGKMVLVKKLGTENSTLNVGSLKAGMYILKASENNKTSLIKFIKK
jgi:hypothetical protein